MSDQPLAELPPEIGLLLALESEAYGDDLALRADVLAHVERSVTLRGPAGGGTGGGTGGGAGGIARELLRPAIRALVAVGTGAFVAGALVGGLVVRAASLSAVTPAIVASLPAPTESAPPLPIVVVPEPNGASSSVFAPLPTPRDLPSAELRLNPKPVDAAAGGSDLVREREVIDAARAALARGRPADALVTATRHAERWPHGQLAEEREVIAIQALAASGRRAEAERRAAAFKRAFPSSMLIPAVDAAFSSP